MGGAALVPQAPTRYQTAAQEAVFIVDTDV
jgi:hypothetical protein